MKNQFVRTALLVVVFVAESVVLVVGASRGPCEPDPAALKVENNAAVCTSG